MVVKRKRHRVSEHAVLRWLERGHGIDVDGFRRQIADNAERGVDMGKENGYRRKLYEGMVYVLAESGEVVTCYKSQL